MRAFLHVHVRMHTSLCVCVHNSLPAVVTLMLTQANIFSIPWINASAEGLEELLLTQAKLLVH